MQNTRTAPIIPIGSNTKAQGISIRWLSFKTSKSANIKSIALDIFIFS